MAIKPIQILINAKDNASSVFSSLQAKIVGVGVAIAGYFGIEAFAGAVKGAADLESKISALQAVSGATAGELQQMRDAAVEAGSSTQFTASEAADALGNLARAGLSAGESVQSLVPTLQLATAGGLGLSESSDIMTKSLSGFGLAADQAGRIADVLAKGANASNTSVTGLGQALSYAAPVAVSLGLSLEETVAIIGKFSDAGIDAGRAGTALNSILAQFSDPAGLFRKELAAAGITTNDFGQALRELEARGPAGSKAILAVGREAGPALRSLLNQGIGALDELTGKLKEAGGSAAETAAIMQNNLNGATLGLSSAWDTVTNALATPVLPILKDGVDQLANALRGAVSDGTVGKFGDAIANAFRGAITWARAFVAEVDFGAMAAKISSAADQVGDAFTRVATYAQTAGNITKTAWGVMSAGADTVLAAIYGVGAAMAATASVMQEQIAKILSGLGSITFGGVSAGFKEAADDMRLSAEATLAAAGALGDKAKQSLLSVADGAQLAREGWAGLTEETETAVAKAEASTTVFKQLGDTLTEAGSKAQAMGEKTKTALTETQATAEQTAKAVADAFQRMGVQTKDDLTAAAANAQRDFDLIKASGQATAEGLAAAFKKYAEAAIAANGGVATDALKSQAAMHGLEVASDSAGKAIVRAMGSGAQAAGGLTTSIQGATQAVQEHIGWLDRLEKRNAEVKSSLQTDANGFAADAKGNTIAAGGDLTTLTGIAAFLKSAGVQDDAQARKLATEFSDGKGSIPYFSNPGQQKYGGDTISMALLKAAETITFAGTGVGGAAKTGTTSIPNQAAREVNVNVAIGGQSYGTVPTTESGANALESFMSALQRGRGTVQ